MSAICAARPEETRNPTSAIARRMRISLDVWRRSYWRSEAPHTPTKVGGPSSVPRFDRRRSLPLLPDPVPPKPPGGLHVHGAVGVVGAVRDQAAADLLGEVRRHPLIRR